jgi:hypothetical protein
MIWRILLATGLALIVASAAAGDSIVIGGVTYDNVIVRDGPSQYYVQIPSDGRTISASKSDVKPEDVVIGKDKAARRALLEEWGKNNAQRPKPPNAEQNQPKKPLQRRLTPSWISSDPVAGSAPSYGPKASGVVEQVRSAAGGATVETGTFEDEKGVKRLVLKGNRQKEEGFENRAEQARAQLRAAAQTPPPQSGGEEVYAPEMYRTLPPSPETEGAPNVGVEQGP